MNVKEARKALMMSMLVPAPKPYIQAAYDAARPVRRKKKLTDTDKGAYEAFLFTMKAKRS